MGQRGAKNPPFQVPSSRFRSLHHRRNDAKARRSSDFSPAVHSFATVRWAYQEIANPGARGKGPTGADMRGYGYARDADAKEMGMGVSTHWELSQRKDARMWSQYYGVVVLRSSLLHFSTG